MWHSLEHFPEPQKIISKARKMLKDDGVLMIGLPNFGSLDRKMFKGSWNGMEIPLHLCHFKPESIRLLLKESDFEVEKIVHTIRPSDLTKSIIYFLEDRYHLKTNRILRILLFGISIPMSMCFSLCRRSSIIKVFAK
jgi:2-polyprenyl-3-methyl-5-hydroxy-6-metoxy-1,4-benzoquinol methylase